MSRIMTVGLLLVGLTLFGCANESRKWYGIWEGDLKVSDPAMPNDDLRRMVDLAKLSIKPDGTFELMRSSITVSGTHRLGKDKAFFTITRILDQPISTQGPGTQKMNKDLTATWEEDGSLLLNDPTGFESGPVKLTRTSQPVN